MNKKNILITSIFIASIGTIMLLSNQLKHTVVIHDTQQTVTIRTAKRDVDSILKAANIELIEEDKLNIDREKPIKNDMDIFIERAEPINYYIENETGIIFSTELLVKDILEQHDFEYDENDRIYPQKNMPLSSDRKIEIVSVDIENESIEEKIEYKQVVQYTDDLKPGETRILSEGKDGKKSVEFQVIYENQNEVSKKKISETIIDAPVDEIIQKGKENYVITSRGIPFRYKAVMIMDASAYDLSFESCGKYPDHPEYGITFSGTHARPGVVAVDRRTIPLGSKLYVESLDYTDDYGFAKAEDIGGAIKEDRIDLFIADNAQAMWYGRRYVKVYILDESFDESFMKGYSN